MSSKSGRDSEPASEHVVVGRGVRPHGLRGEVKIEIHSDVTGRFRQGACLSALVDGERRDLVVTSFRPVRDGGLIAFRGIEDREQAESLRGVDFEVARDEVPAPPSGSFYFFELIGCRCVDSFAGDLGLVTEVIEDGGGLLLSVESDRGTVLIPFAAPFLESVDEESGVILVHLPEGLVETCTSRS